MHKKCDLIDFPIDIFVYANLFDVPGVVVLYIGLLVIVGGTIISILSEFYLK